MIALDVENTLGGEIGLAHRRLITHLLSMLAKASLTVVAVTLAGAITVAYTDPSWTIKPSRAAEEAPSAGGIARCPVPRASGEMTRVFDTESLPGGPYYVNDHTLIPSNDGRWHLFGIFALTQ